MMIIIIMMMIITTTTFVAVPIARAPCAGGGRPDAGVARVARVGPVGAVHRGVVAPLARRVGDGAGGDVLEAADVVAGGVLRRHPRVADARRHVVGHAVAVAEHALAYYYCCCCCYYYYYYNYDYYYYDYYYYDYYYCYYYYYYYDNYCYYDYHDYAYDYAASGPPAGRARVGVLLLLPLLLPLLLLLLLLLLPRLLLLLLLPRLAGHLLDEHALGPSMQSVTESQQSIPDPAGSAGWPVCWPAGVSASQYQLLGVGPASPVLQTTCPGGGARRSCSLAFAFRSIFYHY